MAIAFNNIPDATRTPGAYTEIDNSRALKGLVANPHKVLVVGQKISAGTVSAGTLVQVTSEGLIDGFFGAGSILARLCRKFKDVNPNTDLYALPISVSAAAVAASGELSITGSVTTTGTLYLLVNGTKVYTPVTSGWSGTDVVSAIHSDITAISALPLRASIHTSVDRLVLIAKNSGEAGNRIDFRLNYYEGQSTPLGLTVTKTALAGGATNPDLGEAWAAIANEHFHYIINPYDDAANLVELEDELETRFGPMVDQQGGGWTGYRGTVASCTVIGNSRNSPYNVIIGANDSPTDPAEWAAVLGAVAAQALNDDPARPLQYLKLKGVLAPPSANRFERTDRNTLLYDGISTWITDSSGNVLTERIITTYQKTALGTPDPSYLDIETMYTLMEIRYQYKVRMVNRFLSQRFKLADDTFPVQGGQKIVTPSVIKQEIIALFTQLRDAGLIENIDEFITNLIVERNADDVNRVDVLLPPDLINQFRLLATQIQFIL